MKKIKLLNPFVITAFAIIIDQLSKFYMKDFLYYKLSGYKIFSIDFENWQLVELKLYYLLNKGISFSFLSSQDQTPLIVLTSIISIVLCVWISRVWNQSTALFLSLVLGGAIGNIFDRIYHGGVVDFISFSFGGYYFPAFNPADVFIFIGVALILFEDIFAKSPKKG